MRRWIYILMCVVCLVGATDAQKAKKSKQLRRLETQRQSVLNKIKHTDQELRRIKKNTEQEQKRLKLVRQQVSQRKEVIGILGSEISALQMQIDSLGIHIRHLSSREATLLQQYAGSLRALQHDLPQTDRLLFLLSSRSFDEAYQRQRFLGQYARANQKIVRELKLTRQGIEQTQRTINDNQNEKKQLLALRDNEKRELEREEGKRQANVQTLKGQEKKLAQQLEQQRKQAQKLEHQIQAQIAAEIARAEEEARKQQARREARARARRQAQEEARKAAEAKAAKGSKTRTKPEPKPTPEPEADEAPETERRSAIAGGYAMNAEERKLSGSFAQNRGRLPMPVRGRYDLLRRFGRQQHASLKRVEVVSGGIDLKAHGDKHAYAVFSGIVSSVFETPGYRHSIIIRHGNYLTVYANLASVSVHVGQRVSTGHKLGTIDSSSGSDRASVLHFQLWHERIKQDPLPWLKR
ncbi:MAG: peptidoglycan DD-metalloendopeptidase family protein [Porphyromonadaceae bacterium]|nr:peptidoglycan DD-metalloendopeptidase family protein [Porphyromonadaceae bacterium]